MEQMGEQGGERDRLVEVLWRHWGKRHWQRDAFLVYIETLSLSDLNYILPYAKAEVPTGTPPWIVPIHPAGSRTEEAVRRVL